MMEHDRRLPPRADPRALRAVSDRLSPRPGGAHARRFSFRCSRGLNGGTFVLRIEDTDVERSSEEMVTGLLDGLRWLGLETGTRARRLGASRAVFSRSQRTRTLSRARHSRGWSRTGRAYCFFCSAETLQKKRDDARARGQSTQYDRTCLVARAPRRSRGSKRPARHAQSA